MKLYENLIKDLSAVHFSQHALVIVNLDGLIMHYIINM